MFFKNFFWGGGMEEVSRERQNIGLLWGKVPMFCLKSTDVYAQEVRCFLNPGLICFLQIYDEDLYAVGRARAESPKGT